MYDPNLFQGDIVLTPAQKSAISRGQDPSRVYGRGSVNKNLWPGAVLPYTIDGALGKWTTSSLIKYPSCWIVLLFLWQVLFLLFLLIILLLLLLHPLFFFFFLHLLLSSSFSYFLLLLPPFFFFFLIFSPPSSSSSSSFLLPPPLLFFILLLFLFFMHLLLPSSFHEGNIYICLSIYNNFFFEKIGAKREASR